MPDFRITEEGLKRKLDDLVMDVIFFPNDDSFVRLLEGMDRARVYNFPEDKLTDYMKMYDGLMHNWEAQQELGRYEGNGR